LESGFLDEVLETVEIVYFVPLGQQFEQFALDVSQFLLEEVVTASESGIYVQVACCLGLQLLLAGNFAVQGHLFVEVSHSVQSAVEFALHY
jgi:hypothetical protein